MVPRTLKDYQRGFKLLKQAAALNHIGAYGWLGAAFDYGLGTRANRRRAFQCYLRAAKEGEPNSEYHVGVFYMAGRGVRKIALWPLHGCKERPAMVINMQCTPLASPIDMVK
jgi:TPR repeat protein